MNFRQTCIVASLSMLASPLIAQSRDENLDASSATPSSASEGQDDDWQGFLALGVGARPQYQGSKHYELVPAVLGRISYKNHFLEFQGQQARLSVSPFENLTFGPTIDLENGRDEGIKNLKVARLPRLKEAVQVGGFVGYRFGDLLREVDEFSVLVTYLRDVSNVYDGGLAQAQLSYGTNLGNRVSVGASVRGTYADRRYARTYFGVTSAQAVASGLQVHDLQGGIRDIQLGSRIGYALSERWSLQAIGSYKRLLGDFKDSPVVRDGGTANQLSGAVGVAFRF